MKYTVTVRGPLPHDLGRKVSQAHAQAVEDAKVKPTNAVIAPVGERGKPDATGQPH